MTGLSGDTLTLAGVLEGTTDRNYAVGDDVRLNLTAGAIVDLNTMAAAATSAIAAIQTSLTADEVTLASHTTELASHASSLTADATAITTLQTSLTADEVTLASHTTELASHASSITTLSGDVTTIDTALALLAPLASPTFTGTPAAPTAAPGTNTTQLATTAHVLADLAAYTGSTNLVTAGDLVGRVVHHDRRGRRFCPDCAATVRASHINGIPARGSSSSIATPCRATASRSTGSGTPRSRARIVAAGGFIEKMTFLLGQVNLTNGTYPVGPRRDRIARGQSLEMEASGRHESIGRCGRVLVRSQEERHHDPLGADRRGGEHDDAPERQHLRGRDLRRGR